MDARMLQTDSWHHGPKHIFKAGSILIVTAGTYLKHLYFRDRVRLNMLQKTIFEQAENFHWNFHAWAVMANHYHFVAEAMDTVKNLKRMIQAIHSISARELNALDGTPGRKVWHQYRDTTITNERSYFARLNYVNRNPEKHGLVTHAIQYPWCSMRWFVSKTEVKLRRTVMTFDSNKISIEDDFGFLGDTAHFDMVEVKNGEQAPLGESGSKLPHST